MKTMTLKEFFLDEWWQVKKHFDYRIWKILNPDMFDFLIKVEDECLSYKPCGGNCHYYRLRGKRVSKEQAVDIISRTDDFFPHVIGDEDLRIHLNNFLNVWFSANPYDKCHGWVQPSGIVGGNGILRHRADFNEIVGELLVLKMAFPYLELLVAITDWDEKPYYIWDIEDDSFIDLEDYKNFESHIVMVLHLQENMLEVLGEDEGVRRYREFLSIYEGGIEDTSIFAQEYYRANKISPVDDEFFKSCLQKYNLTMDNYRQSY